MTTQLESAPTPPTHPLTGLPAYDPPDSGRLPDFSFLQSPPGTFDEVNSALRDSSVILQGRELSKVGVRHNAYCLALALVFYAIREHSTQLWPEHVPSEQN
jgi:hypothetical protein